VITEYHAPIPNQMAYSLKELQKMGNAASETYGNQAVNLIFVTSRKLLFILF
jgi:hypothetical protein